ncbi:Lrp/AsnC family transcriptional regulator [Microbacterium rhizosphaerae]
MTVPPPTPNSAGALPEASRRVGLAAPTPERLDAPDAVIVAAISRNARATLSELSAEVGLSVSAVQARLRRLESRGVISGYRPILDAEAVGKPLSAFVEITPLDPAQPDNAPELLEHLDEIEACHSIAGDASYMLFVRVASPRELERLIRDIRLAANVRTRTTIVLQTFYENRPIAPA